MKNQMIGKIARVVDGKVVIVAHVLTKHILEVEPYKLTPKKCPGLIFNLTDG